LFAGGEGEVAGADGFFQQEGFECGGGFEHARILKSYGPRGKTRSVGNIP
jgi:hypothetical protein